MTVHSLLLPPAPLLLPQVPFVSVPHSEMSLMSLMTHGIHALPVLQVNARVSPDAVLFCLDSSSCTLVNHLLHVRGQVCPSDR